MTQKEIAEDIRKAVETLRRGGLILYPTDTVWGIGCDATNEEAVRRIFALKQRAEAKAMLCLVDSANRLQRYVRQVPDVAWDLIEFAERPLTLILDGAVNLAPSLIAEDGSVGLRVTREAISHELCYRFQKAVVSTSANISGQPAAAIFSEIDPAVIAGVDYVMRSRQNDTKPTRPSQIMRLKADGEFKVLRP
ncbi:MAG: threonylcarbamoyl-AMP synthase [Bacteroidaceae bacterium]|nr:threonylcarbamoyl-AMP synthase [Bacteroidaceae bacterium]MBR6818943.1 threonylcarbamoyl-AMP synthase [Bacteroidaceae bacterium]MBR7052296.1 threonylcarbamoyl-AMP synthase [Bacteroidaceae bacterium]